MAKKPKINEVEEEKERLAREAKAINKAAEKLAASDSHFGTPAYQNWERIKTSVSDLDRGFREEEMMNDLRQRFGKGDVDFTVLQVGPDGRLKDVSNSINLKNIKPGQVTELIDDGRRVPLSRHPKTAEAAMNLLTEMLGGRSRIKSGPESATTAESIRRMEIVLAESDKILQHWKK